MRQLPAACGAALLAIAMVAPAAAQRPAVSFGVAGGPTFPVGDLGTVVDAGWHAQATVNFGAGVAPLGVRAELLYQQLDGDAMDARHLAAFLTAVASSPGAGFAPYLMAGAGIYDLDIDPGPGGMILADGGGLDSGTQFGVNAGAGVGIAMVGYALTLEARFHHVFTDGANQQTLPISIGLRF